MKTNFVTVIFSILFLFNSYLAHSQLTAIENIKPWQLKSYAKSAERSGDVYSAISYYEAYEAEFPNDLKIARDLAELYRKARDYEKASFSYLKTYHLDIDKYKLSLFYYAQMEKMQGNYERAIEYFERFIKEYRDEKDEKEYRKLANVEIAGCKLALDLYEKKSKQRVIINHLNSSINKAHIELSPTYINDNTLLYASLATDSLRLFPVDDTSGWPVRKFFIARRQNNEWYGGNKFIGPFNKKGINTGNGAFSPDGERFYFNRCEKNWQNKIICHLFVSYKVNDKWQEPIEASGSINMENYTTTQPSVALSWKKNKEIVYFSSDRPEGKGGMDIWYSLYDTVNQVFSEPKNLSRKINTQGDEITPFYDNISKSLYFSSNGRPNVGGLDIFKAIGEESKFQAAENLGFPYNSEADDLYFVVNKNESEGFLVSNRPGGTSLINETCCDDIYSFFIPNYIHYSVSGILEEDENNILQQYISNQAIDTKNEKGEEAFKTPRLQDVLVSLYLIDKNTMETVLINKSRTNHEGEYNFTLMPDKDYKIIINEDGIFTKEYRFNTHNSDNPEIELDTTALVIMPDQPLVIKNIYYDFDRSTLSDIAKTSIDTTLLKILSQIPKIIVEISAHTDNKGNDAYNLRLSQSRAESVVKYLVSKGISSDRLIAKGYGETRPLVPNTFPDGSDNPAGREKNRRTEFRIVGRVGELDDH
ncbi:MAG: OmpA family protein [Chlorobi bacterium]|nr:OmpA family protein [Chlorobiota bacterium]